MSRASIDLNADVGEGCASDAELVPLVSSVNIACGGHAGDDAPPGQLVEGVEQVGGEVSQALGLLLGQRDTLARVGYVDRLVLEIISEQLEHPVERGQRRPQLM